MILDVGNQQWSTGPSLPTPWESMKSCTVEDTWYPMGGGDDKGYGLPCMFAVSLKTLVSPSALHSTTIWRQFLSLHCTWSCPLNIGGSLLAVGGWDEKPVSSIQRYVPETNTWVLTGQLPHAVKQ